MGLSILVSQISIISFNEGDAYIIILVVPLGFIDNYYYYCNGCVKVIITIDTLHYLMNSNLELRNNFYYSSLDMPCFIRSGGVVEIVRYYYLIRDNDYYFTMGEYNSGYSNFNGISSCVISLYS